MVKLVKSNFFNSYLDTLLILLYRTRRIHYKFQLIIMLLLLSSKQPAHLDKLNLLTFDAILLHLAFSFSEMTDHKKTSCAV